MKIILEKVSAEHFSESVCELHHAIGAFGCKTEYVIAALVHRHFSDGDSPTPSQLKQLIEKLKQVVADLDGEQGEQPE